MDQNNVEKIDDPIRVELTKDKFIIQLEAPKLPKKKKTKVSKRVKTLLIIFGVVGVLIGVSYVIALMKYVFPKNKPLAQNITSNISIVYEAPKYLSVGDEHTIDLTIINNNLNEPFVGTITLKFHNPDIKIKTLTDQGVSLSIDNLPPGGRITRSIKITISENPSQDVIYYYFQIPLPGRVDKTQVRSYYDKFMLSPIPKLRSSLARITSILGSVGLLGLLVDYLWELFKQRFLSNTSEK